MNNLFKRRLGQLLMTFIVITFSFCCQEENIQQLDDASILSEKSSATNGDVQILAAGTLTVNFASVINSAGSPLLFGGSNEPTQAHYANVYPKLKTAGVKFQRGTLHVDRLFATRYDNITLNDYLNNVNGASDPNNWDWSALTWADNAKTQGITTMANIFFSPKFLTYNGNVSGVPKNWTVYQDIIKKVMIRYGAKFDFVELLNEPVAGSFITLAGSPYSSKPAAAKDMYYYAAAAVRAVNSTVKLGGDGDDKQGGDFGALGTILRDTRNTASMIQFVSYHIYNPNPPANNKYSEMITLLNNTGRSGLPIYITEFNHNYSASTTDAHVVGNKTVTFLGQTLMGFMCQPQIKGAAIYAFLPNNQVLDPQEDCVGCSNIAQGIYSWSGSNASLRTTTRAWRLMSSSMGLGNGTYKVYTATGSGVTYGVGATNNAGNLIAMFANETSTANTLTVNLTNIQATGTRTVRIYTADTGSNDGSIPTSTLNNVPINNGKITLTNVAIPANALIGIIVQ